MTRRQNFRNILSMKQLGRIMLRLLLLLLTRFPPVSILSRVRRSLDFLHVSVEQLTQFAFRVFTPMRQAHAIACTLMCVSSKALTVAHLRWTLTHVHLTEVKILVWIHATIAIVEEVMKLQLVTFRHDPFLSVQTVLRSLRMLVGLSRASPQSTNTPTVSKLPHLILRHVDACPRRQIIAPYIVVIPAQSTELVFVADGRLDLKKVVAVPYEFDAEMRFDNHLVVLVAVNFHQLVDNMRQFDT